MSGNTLSYLLRLMSDASRALPPHELAILRRKAMPRSSERERARAARATARRQRFHPQALVVRVFDARRSARRIVEAYMRAEARDG